MLWPSIEVLFNVENVKKDFWLLVHICASYKLWSHRQLCVSLQSQNMLACTLDPRFY